MIDGVPLIALKCVFAIIKNVHFRFFDELFQHFALLSNESMKSFEVSRRLEERMQLLEGWLQGTLHTRSTRVSFGKFGISQQLMSFGRKKATSVNLGSMVRNCFPKWVVGSVV